MPCWRGRLDGGLTARMAAGGATVQAAADQGGVSERTAYRRLEDPAFRQRVADARAELIARAVGRLADASADAAATLRALLTAESEMARLGAARSILDLAIKLRESEELEARIRALEDHATVDQPRGGRAWAG